jgi:uncharacterized protein YlaI
MIAVFDKDGKPVEKKGAYPLFDANGKPVLSGILGLDYYDNDGNVCQYRSHPGGVVERRTREKRLIKHFDDASFKKKKISNLKIKMFRSKECLDKMIELGRRGITMYYVPSPKKYKF